MRTSSTMKSLLYAAGIAMLATACSNDDAPQAVDITKPINLSFGIGKPADTKVTIEDQTSVFEADNQVGVFLATSAQDEEAPIGAGEYVNNVPFTCDGQGNWTGAIYWQNTTEVHTLYAYYPYNATDPSETSPEVIIAADQQDGTAYKAADYLWGKAKIGIANTNDQSINLEHKMARIKIVLTAGTDVTNDEVDGMAASLKIKNGTNGKIFSKGTFDVTNKGTVTPSAAELDYIQPYRTGQGGKYTYYAILFPTTQFTHGEEFVRLELNGTPYLYKLSTSSALQLEAGKEYVFNLEANKAGITIKGFTIQGWSSQPATNGGADMVI